MNKDKIKELIQRAGTDTSGKWMGVEHAEVFAELIVAECVSLMEWQKISPKDDGAYNSALSLAQRNIKEQFGVKK